MLLSHNVYAACLVELPVNGNAYYPVSHQSGLTPLVIARFLIDYFPDLIQLSVFELAKVLAFVFLAVYSPVSSLKMVLWSVELPDLHLVSICLSD